MVDDFLRPLQTRGSGSGGGGWWRRSRTTCGCGGGGWEWLVVAGEDGEVGGVGECCFQWCIVNNAIGRVLASGRTKISIREVRVRRNQY